MQIPQQTYDDYLKKPVGEFDAETAAYLYEKEGQKLKLRHPLTRLLLAKPWLVLLPPLIMLILSVLGNTLKSAVQTQQIPPSSGNPVTVNNVFNIQK